MNLVDTSNHWKVLGHGDDYEINFKIFVLVSKFFIFFKFLDFLCSFSKFPKKKKKRQV